jgi:DNA polymerase-1
MAGYPGIGRWQEMTKMRAVEQQFAETAFGFRRIMKGIRSGDWGTKSFWERTAMNTPIQGTAAGIIKLAMGRLLQELSHNLWLLPTLQIHDELLCLCPIEKLQEAASIMKRCMEVQPYPDFDVPVIAEGAYGTCFGELEEME